MKYLTTLLLILVTISLVAQDENNDRLEMGFFIGGGDGSPGMTTGLKLSYARDVGLGIFVKPSYRQFQGGDEYYSTQNFQTRYFQARTLGLAVQKAVNSSKDGSINLTLGGIGSWTHDTFPSGVNSDGTVTEVEYSSSFKFGAEAELAYYHIIKKDLGVFLSAAAATTEVFSVGLGMYFDF